MYRIICLILWYYEDEDCHGYIRPGTKPPEKDADASPIYYARNSIGIYPESVKICLVSFAGPLNRELLATYHNTSQDG